MLFERVLFCLLFLHSVNLQLQINLYLTDWISENENSQHDCLHVPAYVNEESQVREIISYCMGELPSKFNIKENNIDQKLTFDELAKQNITNQQLYLWSAPIDHIEKYQFYLNQLRNAENTTMGTQIFYNCTLPYFGPKCQYIFNDYKSFHSSLYEIIDDYYHYNEYEPTLFTCYIHLECNRGPFPSCLDWTEICDGKVNCLDGGYDEEHCWQLEIHQCNDNEYQCTNGQCIPIAFLHDDRNHPDCLDISDELDTLQSPLFSFNIFKKKPTFGLEDSSCAEYNSFRSYKINIFTSSCVDERSNLLFRAMVSIKQNLTSNECWTALKCILNLPIDKNPACFIICGDMTCPEIIRKTCPDMIHIPVVPIFFDHIYIVFDKNKLIHGHRYTYQPNYICYDDRRLYVPNDHKTFLLSNNDTCRLYKDSATYSNIRVNDWIGLYGAALKHWLDANTTFIDNNSTLQDRSMMYKCMNWPKYISKSRLFDSVNDCYYGDDENILNKSCTAEKNPNYFKCMTTNECIPRKLVENKNCDCSLKDDMYCDDENLDRSYARSTISFQTICDGFNHLLPIMNETDETNCENWPLINIYNHCDGFWHNPDGSDEINCDSSSLINCPANNHICISPETNQLMCLPIEKVNDKIIHCLGGVDEPTKCRNYSYTTSSETFYCRYENNDICRDYIYICNGYDECDNNEDEQACNSNDFLALTRVQGICTENYELFGSDNAKVLCRHFTNIGERWEIYFTLDQSQNLKKQHIEDKSNLPHRPINQEVQSYQQRCHRGLDLQVWLDKEKSLTTNVCLCPPSYYGDICQYQNQRVALTLQFRVTSDSIQTPFIIIISLIDDSDERIIHSSEQLTHLSVKNCQRKYNIYLLYSTRPKDEMKQYSIHIDIYEKKTFTYRTSIIKSLNFSFLPVHRIVFQLDIPRTNDDIDDCSDNQCINGKCFKYYNDPNNKTFCQCQRGWSGRYCTIPYNCTCSSDALYLGKLANNRSLCVCPLNKMGSRCLIDDTICQNNKTVTCFNMGKCIPIDEYEISTGRFACDCPKEYSGDRCELGRTKVTMLFDRTITLPSLIRIHFIEDKFNKSPVHTTTFKRNRFEQDSFIIYWSLPFHIVLVEPTNRTYYLVYMEKVYNQSSIIEKTINSSDQCLNINEVFNETIAKSSLIRRIKYYHLPCQINSSKLLCFYDDIHLCLCQQLNQQRVANCLLFNHTITLDCSGQNGCENGGQCFQENTDCPKLSICQCPPCFYGARCQINTKLHSLSLDVILDYHIRPNIQISHQPFAVLISLIITVIITVIGLINGILSLITFKNKLTRESGCGIYLLCSSIITLLTMIIFLLKFLILLFSQMKLIKNLLFLRIQCYAIDFLLQFNLTMNQWLTAFVAIERAFIVMKRMSFSKKKAISTAKWIITGSIFIIIVTNILDPIYRTLFEENDNSNEDDEKRIWCVVEFPSIIGTINSIMNIFHVSVPFIINLLSAIIIIVMKTRQEAAVKQNQKLKKILYEQIEQHKNLLIGPCVLVILGIPRLIILFASGCMKSSRDSWLFLLGYFITFIPSLLTFILFVLPSNTYKQAFKKAISRYRNIIR